RRARGARRACPRPRAPLRARPRRRAWLCRSSLPQLGADRRDDLVQVADHGVVSVGEDRRLGIGVDCEQLLRPLAAGDVLRGAADPAGDVEVRRDFRARLADLTGVRPRARAAGTRWAGGNGTGAAGWSLRSGGTRASWSSVPPHRWRVTSSSRTAVTFAASGRSRRAAT